MFARGSEAEFRPWTMSRQLADRILEVQAQLAWLRDHHSGGAGDPEVASLLDDVEALLADAVGSDDDARQALCAADQLVSELGATSR